MHVSKPHSLTLTAMLPHACCQPPIPPGFPCWLKVIQKISSYISFAPMILVAVIPDIRLAAIVGAAVAIFNFLTSSLFYWRGIYRVSGGAHEGTVQ